MQLILFGVTIDLAPDQEGRMHNRNEKARGLCLSLIHILVIPIADEDFQTAYYFLCLEKDREKFGELISRLQEKKFQTEPL